MNQLQSRWLKTYVDGSDPVDFVLTKAQDLTIEDSALRVEKEGSA